MIHKIHNKLKPWYVVLLLLILWWMASKARVWNSYLLPPPEKVFATFLSMLRSGEIQKSTAVSLRRVLTGFSLSFVLAFIGGLIAAYAPGFAGYFRYLGNFFRNVPPLALISLLILWFGLGELPKLIIIVLASFFPMLMNIASGFVRCDKGLLEVGQSLGLSGIKQFFRIRLPSSRLDILTGIRIGLGYAWRALIGAEMFAAASGLGYTIVFAQQMSRSDKVFIGIFLIGIIGSVTDAVLQKAIDRLGRPSGKAPEVPEESACEAYRDSEPEGLRDSEPEGLRESEPEGLRDSEPEAHRDTAFFSSADAKRGTLRPRVWAVKSPKTDEAGCGSSHDSIVLENVSKRFAIPGQELEVLRDLNLTLPLDGITVVLGKSGCGKTTLLRMIAGLDRDYSGTIRFPGDKKCAVAFQESRLMPWLNVRGNIVFGLRKSEIREERVRRLLSLTGLTGFEKAKPYQLSGGMQQRTAIARALAVAPDYLLMDEPFAALDYFTRIAMQRSLLDIRRQTGCGVLFITHNIEEALMLGDQILVLGQKTVRKRYILTDPDKVAGGESRSLSELKEDILLHI